MNSADRAETPVTVILKPIFRAGSVSAARYILSTTSPLPVSHRVMAAVKHSGSDISARAGTPAREAEAVNSSRATVVAVSKPSPNRNPMT